MFLAMHNDSLSSTDGWPRWLGLLGLKGQQHERL